MIRQKEICSCEHESESFLGKNDEEDIEFKENLMKCLDNGSQLKELMVRSSKEILESHDFKTNVYAGSTEARQLFCVVTEDEKRKIQACQEMKEDFYNLPRKEKKQLLNTVVEDSVNIGQLWKAEAKEEQLLSVVVGDHQLPKDINIEDNQDKEDWWTINVKKENNEDCAEFLGEIPSEMVSLYNELSLLEKRQENQRVQVQNVKSELNENEVV